MTFDHFLVPGAIDASNWTGRLDGRLRTGTVGATAGKIATVTMDVGSADAGPDVCSYSPPPFDVISVHTTAQQAFVDFPVTLI